ncbi:MAG TPA: hypothetical protein VMF29_00215 [Candidatus Edwardsbacteria bacterium]|nr:hypothetical protein [Candidatus Edwardsbacteria bacterium]
MSCIAGDLLQVFNTIVILIMAALALVWTCFSIRFFAKGAKYYQSKLDEREARKDHGAELLAKLDQLVDVLKVK